MDTPNPAPAKKTPTAPQLGDKYNIKPPVLKRPRYCILPKVLTPTAQHHLVVYSCSWLSAALRWPMIVLTCFLLC